MKSILLPPLSVLYGAVVSTRTSLYTRGTFRTKRLERPVISIGNITAGGTGKTPMAEWVARVLVAEGKRVCILTRGYGRKNPNERVLVSDGQSVLTTAEEAGDEPFLLATNLTGIAAVVCDQDRYAAGTGAIKHLKTECFILDDGFQHLQLARDLNIVTIDATNPFGGGHLLPYGTLRESVSGLDRADCIVLTRTDQQEDLGGVKKELRKLTGDRPIFTSRMKVSEVTCFGGNGTELTLGSKVAAFCAIGNSSTFYRQVRHAGFSVVYQKSFTDHHRYSQSDLDKITRKALESNAAALITTAKDAVKLTGLKLDMPCFVLQIEIDIDNASTLKHLIVEAANL
jgi:tetraacyldisaccharide 4'-kinase